ncbi:LacI family DNA-binding transcriptional regulator [Mediterraneibacter sp. NSJ-55]|uniref:LacI family DNA-binding transcriptional regulator n=1 Tax=Mediterraneibacter hominis TaxID=2763054 RepID=A0A923LJ14_9FIRM|nr:LacI family DNA-binding transcriptional regulator [Mediterraneibacter hominis]MBC5689737.1 LacI family DNA-binding transcriptional regulator [Mediterraneibacter hominis]
MNIYDIAKEAGVSPSTVSRVLNNRDNVKKGTREKVLQVIEGKAYKPNLLARSLSVGVSRNIAFLAPDIENPFFSKILHGISDCAIEKDYNVFMFGTDENTEREHKILENLKPEMMMGLIITPVSERDENTVEWLKRFEQQGIPIVLVDRDIRGCKFDGVFSNDEESACEAVECLIEEGHKKIGVITGPETSKPGHDRCAGYKRALKKHNIEINENYIVRGGFKEEGAYRAMKALMEQKEPPTAVFSCNNMTTLGCLRYMQEKGMKLTRDISMVCFDEIKELEYTDIHLTSVARPIYEMGYEAMHILEKRYEDKEKRGSDRYIIRRHIVNPYLVKRGSEKYLQF